MRKTVALHLASLGRAESIPALARLLEDANGFVRSYVGIGVRRAVADGRADDEFRRRAYDLLLPQCDQEWEGDVNDAADVVVELDPQRAATDFASGRWLTSENLYAYQILEACNRSKIPLPEDVVRPLYEHALPRATGALLPARERRRRGAGGAGLPAR